MGTHSIQINGSHNLMSMAPWMCQYVRTEPRPFTKKAAHRFAGEDAGCGQAVQLPPSLLRVRRPETQGDSPKDVPADSFDRHHSKIRPMTLSRVVTSSFLRMLFWKGVVEMATQEFLHYERVWDGLEEFEDAVKQNAEPRLLTD